MARTDWSDHQADVFRVAAQEISEGGVHGYLVRTADRLRDELDLDVSKDSLDSFLRRVKSEWAPLRRQAVEAHKTPGQGTVEVTIEQVTPLAADHPQVRDLERKVHVLKADLRDERKRRREADEKAAITQELVSTMETLVDPWEPNRTSVRDRHDAEWDVDMVAILSDEHADRVVDPEVVLDLEHYNHDVFRARLQRWTEVISGFATHHLPKFNFRKLWVLSLGDKVNGDIHNMKLRNHFQNSLKATLATADAEADAFRRLLPLFPEGVHVIGVSGNHPRPGKKHNPEDPHDNLDYVVNAGVAMRLQHEMEEGRFSMHLPRSWMAFAEIRGWQFALSHGDEVRSYRGFPWYGFDRREGRVKALVERAGKPALDVLTYGHFHTETKRSHANSRSYHNGAFYETDPYCVKDLAVGSAPEQKILVVRDKAPDMGPILEIPVYLRDRKREALLHAGKWEPAIGRHTILDAVS